MDEKTTPRHDALMSTFVVVSIIALGIVVAGVTTPPEEPELTVQPVTPVETTPPPPPPEYDVVTPEVAYPTTIPGCDTVDPPVESSYFGVMGFGESTYDNPDAPWFTGPKAHLMSQALVRALPADITFTQGMLPYFDPIPVYENLPEEDQFDSTSALADVTRGDRSGFISIGVAQQTNGVPPCVAGVLDSRESMSDGTVVDRQDTWQEVDGARTSTRSATAYRTDGSQISAYASATGGEDQLPFSMPELVRIATDPAFVTSTPAPPDTPGNIAECSSYPGTEGVAEEFTAPVVASLSDALARADTGNLAPTPPLGALRSSVYGGGALCQVVNSAAGRLTVTVGSPVPSEQLREDPQGLGPIPVRVGTVVSIPTVSGLGVTLVTENPWDPAELERIARTPELISQ
ncbi:MULTISPECIES: hypothetical protein [Nocardiaceae]|uniref:Uncharacterized protein n=1 Tax=Rhodococcoides corynebacterioides TaxID=53972 RepID=A0ABS2KV30_9NOCA|nr:MULTISPECIES: hypothetical protein [Rhodococcus]MBM7415800.1 hypothetical protein [Rhodococcus corynebacterioides]MBP1118262.1 hypothetical protein [Rhodococcus sp. PvP016]